MVVIGSSPRNPLRNLVHSPSTHGPQAVGPDYHDQSCLLLSCNVLREYYRILVMFWFKSFEVGSISVRFDT